MNLLAYGINSQILEGYNPFAFSEGVNERTRENRFEHLEFCIKMMDTDKPMEVVRPNTRWQDPDIKLDPTQMMTFPMTFSPHINSTIAYLVEQRRLAKLELQRKDNEKIPVANLHPPTFPSSLPPPPPPLQPQQSSPYKAKSLLEEIWHSENITVLIKSCIVRHPAKLSWTNIKNELHSINPKKYHVFFCKKSMEQCWLNLLGEKNDTAWGVTVRQEKIYEVERLKSLDHLLLAETVKHEFGEILWSRGRGKAFLPKEAESIVVNED